MSIVGFRLFCLRYNFLSTNKAGKKNVAVREPLSLGPYAHLELA
jgi:hypothetical protein